MKADLELLLTIIAKYGHHLALDLLGHDHGLNLGVVHLFHEVDVDDALLAERAEDRRALVFGQTFHVDVVAAAHGPRVERRFAKFIS